MSPVVRICEDDPDIDLMLQHVLGGIGGHEVISSLHIPLADLLHPGPWTGIDFAVVDYSLADQITGRDILTYLKTSHPSILRILYTAYPDAISDAGDLADTSILKTAAIDRLLEAIR